MPQFRWGAAILLGAATMLMGLAAPGTAAWAAGPGTAWSIQRTPEATVANGSLAAGTCTSQDQCVAVGSSASRAGTAALAESWDGTAWSIQAVPMPPGGTHSALDAASCSTATACTAVGYFTSNLGEQVTLAERWDGSTWSVQPTAVPSGATRSLLAGVSCGSATSCVAVGGDESGPNVRDRLAYSWNGTRWTLVEASAPPGAVHGFLAGVSCGAPAACIAVGSYDNSTGTSLALAEAWNGTAWRSQHPPDPAGLRHSSLVGVSCTSASACMAVGRVYGPRSGATLAESWNGTAWIIRPAPAPPGTFGELSGVSCTSAAACTAVGYYRAGPGGLAVPLAESWNGTAWTVQQVPSPAGGTNIVLDSVSCISPGTCTAVGNYESSGALVGLAERWNGTTWAIQATPDGDDTLYGVSCGSATTCTAVGDSYSFPKGLSALAESWRDGTWKVQRTPFVPGVFTSLYGVSCRSPRACAAAGGYTTGSGLAVPLAEAWNGTVWTLQAAASPRRGGGSVLTGVAPGQDAGFTAVGSHLSGAQVSTTLAETGPG